MAADINGTPNRIPLVCTICMKSQVKLSVHLSRTCMKGASSDEITVVVKKARESMLSYLERRILKYSDLQKRFSTQESLIQAISLLEEIGCFIVGKPKETSPPINQNNSAGISQKKPRKRVREEEEEEEEEQEEQEEEGDHMRSSSDNLYQPDGKYEWKTKVKKAMMEAGLYEKHSVDCELLLGFTRYLKAHLHVKNCQQEVDSVAKFLFYCDPAKPTLDFVFKIEKTMNFFDKIRSAGAASQTAMNYLKYLKRFMEYVLVFTDLVHENQTLYQAVRHYLTQIKLMGKRFSKGVSAETVARRYKESRGDTRKPEECVEVLKKAKPDFLMQMDKLSNNESICTIGQTTILYYLECIIVFRHLQRPGVIKYLMVTEWLERKITVDESGMHRAVVSVKEHKTAAQQMASFSLDAEEENWFEQYFVKLRPQFLRMNITDSEMSEPPQFFISTKGEPIYNPSNDLSRFQKRYGIGKMNSQIARRIVETATKSCTDAQKSKVADYLAHSNATAERHYRMQTTENICAAATLIDTLTNFNQSGNKPVDRHISTASEKERHDGPSTSHSSSVVKKEKLTDESAQILFFKTFPVTLHGNPPTRKERISVVGLHERHMYDKWRTNQQHLRAKEAMSYFSNRQPSEIELQEYHNLKGWKMNMPTALTIINNWSPQEFTEPTETSLIVHMESQDWSGLTIQLDENMRKKTVTLRSFKKSEVVCDFHASRKTFTEGLSILKQMPKKDRNRLLFDHDPSNTHPCYDCYNPCLCHPDKELYGQFVTTSKKNFNVEPQAFEINNGGIIAKTFFFLALKDIPAGQDVTYDYVYSTKRNRKFLLENDS